MRIWVSSWDRDLRPALGITPLARVIFPWLHQVKALAFSKEKITNPELRSAAVSATVKIKPDVAGFTDGVAPSIRAHLDI